LVFKQTKKSFYQKEEELIAKDLKQYETRTYLKIQKANRNWRGNFSNLFT